MVLLAFVHNQKTGGTTVNYMLRSSFGLGHCDVEPWHAPHPEPFMPSDLQRLRRLIPGLRSIAGHRVTPCTDLETVFPHIQYFTMIREPISRCASFYQHEIRAGYDFPFDEWIRRAGNGQTRQIAGLEDVDAAIRMIEKKQIFVGLMERFDESLFLFKSLVAPALNIAYRRMNVAKDNALARQLMAAQDTRQKMIEANREDLALHTYVKEELHLEYRRAYGYTLDEDLSRYREHPGGINRINLSLNLMFRNLVYKPALRLYRRRHSKRTQW